MSLRDVLATFESAVAGTPGARERVGVDVVRGSGFRHDNVGWSGQRSSLDEPVSFGGSGSAPDPAEALLAAVGASVSVTVTAHAALRGVPIDRIHVALSGELDAHLFFRPGSGGTPGLLDMTMTLSIETAAPRRLVQAVVRDALRVAPVLRSLKRLPRTVVVYGSPGRAGDGETPTR